LGQNQFDSIDLSDNAIVRLEGFPVLRRLKQLLLSNNRIMRIGSNLERSIPSLEVLVLNNNRFNNLQDIDPLASLPKLKYLSLLDNPITKKPDYRLYVISKLQQLKVLDFRKVKDKERKEASEKFKSGAPAEAPKTFEPGEGLPQANGSPTEKAPKKKAGPTPEQLTAIQAAIANAQTLEEVTMLEEALATGVMPSSLQLSGGGSAAPMDEG